MIYWNQNIIGIIISSMIDMLHAFGHQQLVKTYIYSFCLENVLQQEAVCDRTPPPRIVKEYCVAYFNTHVLKKTCLQRL